MFKYDSKDLVFYAESLKACFKSRLIIDISILLFSLFGFIACVMAVKTIFTNIAMCLFAVTGIIGLVMQHLNWILNAIRIEVAILENTKAEGKIRQLLGVLEIVKVFFLIAAILTYILNQILK